MEEYSWEDLAACLYLRDEVKDFFFAGAMLEDDEKNRVEVMRQHDEARMICYRECRVQIQCLRKCLESDSEYGIWGGLTQSQRKRYGRRLLNTSDANLRRVIMMAGKRVLGRIEKNNDTKLLEGPS